MSMTRKHFEAIAADIKDAQIEANQFTLSDAELSQSLEGIRMVADRLADTFERFNDNFDRARFIKACGFNVPERWEAQAEATVRLSGFDV